MKKLPELIASVALLAFVVGAATPELIRWNWHGNVFMPYDVKSDCFIQFGLRNDGIVVWREITHTNTTNSPAEDATIRIETGGTNSWPIPPSPWTNIVVTNLPMTNIKAFIDTNYLRLNKATIPVSPSTPFEAWLMSLETP